MFDFIKNKYILHIYTIYLYYTTIVEISVLLYIFGNRSLNAD